MTTDKNWVPRARSDTNMYDATGQPVDSALFLGVPGPTIRPVRVKPPDTPPDPKETPARIARSKGLSFDIARPPSTPR